MAGEDTAVLTPDDTGPPPPDTDISIPDKLELNRELPKNEAQDPFFRAARRTARGQVHRDPTPVVTDDSSYDLVQEGQEFIDPTGNRRKKPYTVAGDEDFDKVPEGADFIDKEGNVRKKPVAESANYSSTTLYHMATNEKERRKALELSYPKERIKQDTLGDFFVETDEPGKTIRPKGFTGAPGANITAMAAPMIGSIAGEIVGAGVGSAVPGPGTLGGALIGSGAGGAAGQVINDIVLGLSGVYDRSVGEEFMEVGKAGLLAGGGTAAGRAVAAVPGGALNMANRLAPKVARNIAGVNEENLFTVMQMKEKGLELFPPSVVYTELPYVANIAEVFDAAFRLWRPMQTAAAKYYDKQARSVAEAMGIDLGPGKVHAQTEAVSSREAGQAVLDKARERLVQADNEMLAAQAAKRAEMEGAAGNVQAQREAVVGAAKEARSAAEDMLNIGYQDIEKSADDALKVANAGHNSGDLWWAVGEKFRAIRFAIGERGKRLYEAAESLVPPGVLPFTQDLPELAGRLLSEVPPDFANRYPTIVQKIRDIAGVMELDQAGNWTGNWIKEPRPPSWSELRQIRSMLRDQADWSTLSSDVKNGTLKFFANHVDDALRDTANVPELKSAVEALDIADDFWRDNMGVFRTKQLQAVMRGLEGGEAADPQTLFNVLIREGQTDLTNRIMDMIGPQLAAGVRAADVKSIINQSKSIVPGQIDGKRFVDEVLDRYRSGMLHAIHGQEMGDKLLKQAQHIDMLNGKIPIPADGGDTALDILQRARVTADAAAQQGKADPLKTLDKEMGKIQGERNRKIRLEKQNDPLGFLLDLTTGAEAAADKILGNSDLLVAAAMRFGRDSPEFEALRQVAVKRMLTNTLNPGQEFKELTRDAQELLFGANLDNMQQLVKEMNLLTTYKGATGSGVNQAGKSIAGQERVNNPNPWKSLPASVRGIAQVPGAGAAARIVMGKVYKTVTEFMSRPELLQFVAKGLKGDDAAKARSREIIDRAIRKYGAAGAATGEFMHAVPHQPVYSDEQGD